MSKSEKRITPWELSTPLASPPDAAAFLAARERVLGSEPRREGIGTLSEKTLHKILKLYIEPDASRHEVDLMGSVADVKNGQGVFEIQTRSYDKLAPKLERLLECERVTVVCPLATDKSVRWINGETGELSPPRKSPRRENIYDAFKMLFGIRRVIANENLTVRVLYLSVDDYRNLDGYGADKKRRSTRMERIPNEILGEITLEKREDYVSLLPPELGEEFVASELAGAIGRTSRYSFYVLKLLVSVGAISETGKRGRAVLYKKNH